MIGLPSLQAMDRSQGARIWMASEATDMRCGFDRLAERVNAVIGENPQSGHLFVFRSRRGDRLKILVWERMDSFCGTSVSKGEFLKCRMWNRECVRWNCVPANSR